MRFALKATCMVASESTQLVITIAMYAELSTLVTNMYYV